MSWVPTEAQRYPRYLYRIVLSVDGNHSLHKKTKPGDTNDIALSHKQGFFVPDEEVAPYMEKKYGKTAEASQTGHKRKRKGKGKAGGEVAVEEDNSDNEVCLG